jgi:hypothetical protein
MSLYGENRDISLFRHLNRELLNNIIEQKVGYYKVILDRTVPNMYGESLSKSFYNPVLVNCLIDSSGFEAPVDEFGPDVTRTIVCKFLRDDLAGIELCTELGPDGRGFNYGIYPEVGDVLLWQGQYFEVDNVNDNQLIVGKDPSYSYSSDTDNFGSSWSLTLTCHYTRPEKLGIEKERL